MSTEHGGEVPGSHEPGYSPYGLAGERAGELACILQVQLFAPGEELPYHDRESVRWTDKDRLAFGYFLEFDESVTALPSDVQEAHAERLMTDVYIFPPGWWAVIKSAHDDAWGVSLKEAYDLIKRGGSFPYEEQLVKVRTDSHRTLGLAYADWWPRWRRRVAKFDAPHHHEDAREALDALVSDLLPNGPRRP